MDLQEIELKGSVQQCVKAMIVFKLVTYVRIGRWPKDDIIMIDVYCVANLMYIIMDL